MIQSQEIQALINEIAKVLPKANCDPLQLKPEDIAQQNRVLERVQNYLKSRLNDNPSTSEPQANISLTEEETAWRIAQAVITRLDRMTGYNSNNQDPDESEQLRQKRDRLRQQVQQLQSQQDHLLNDTWQKLTARLQDKLSNISVPTYDQSRDYPPLVESERLKQLKQDSDQMLRNLDRTFHTVFESLEGDLQAYQQSLSQGLENIHSLGHQSEAIFSHYVDNLYQSQRSPLLSLDESLNKEAEFKAEKASNSSEYLPLLREEEMGEEETSSYLLPFAGVELKNAREDTDTEREDLLSTAEPIAEEITIDKLMSLDLNAEEKFVPLEREADFDQLDFSQQEVNGEENMLPDSAVSLEMKLFDGISDLAEEKEAVTSWSEKFFEEEIASVGEASRRSSQPSPLSPEEPEAMNTIHKLTDLLVETDWQNPEPELSEVKQEVLDTNSSQAEEFLYANSEENLLGEREPEAEIASDLAGFLDQEILQQLSEDLERFEAEDTTFSTWNQPQSDISPEAEGFNITWEDRSESDDNN